MKEHMKINIGSYIREQIIKNLLNAHKRIADNGTVLDLIRLSKFLQKISKQFDDQLFEVRLEEHENCADSPPNKVKTENDFDTVNSFPTFFLTEELSKREGVEKIEVLPYESKEIHAEGPAKILVVTD